MLAKAPSSVLPCDQHPGRPGQDTLYPSSVGIRATWYFTPSLYHGVAISVQVGSYLRGGPTPVFPVSVGPVSRETGDPPRVSRETRPFVHSPVSRETTRPVHKNRCLPQGN